MAHRLLTWGVRRASWAQYGDDDLRHISVKQLTGAVALDGSGHPLPGGLYDPALGPIEAGAPCATCSLPFFECPGHLGHIDLAVPVYNPELFPLLVTMLRKKCVQYNSR